MDQSGETILRLRSENAELRAELERWKQGEDVELRQLKLQIERLQNAFRRIAESPGAEPVCTLRECLCGGHDLAREMLEGKQTE